MISNQITRQHKRESMQSSLLQIVKQISGKNWKKKIKVNVNEMNKKGF